MTNIRKVKNSFYIHHDKFQELDDKATDWFIKSLKFKYNSPEWKICRLQQEIYRSQAKKHLAEALKYINGTL